jgi:hypothetical protein
MRRLFIGACILSLTLSVTPLRAQEIDCEQLSFSALSSLLEEAQTAADGGDKDAALALLAQAQDELTKIQDECTAPPIVDVALTETYESESFSFQYPASFDVIDDQGMFGSDDTYAHVTIATDANVPEQLQEYQRVAEDAQLIAVGVGTREQTVRGLGAFSSDDDYSGANAVELLELAVKNADNTALFFGEIAEITINDQPAAGVFFSAKGNSTTTVADAYIVIVALDDDAFGLVVGVGAAGKGEQVQTLVHAVAETLKLK